MFFYKFDFPLPPPPVGWGIFSPATLDFAAGKDGWQGFLF